MARNITRGSCAGARSSHLEYAVEDGVVHVLYVALAPSIHYAPHHPSLFQSRLHTHLYVALAGLDGAPANEVLPADDRRKEDAHQGLASLWDRDHDKHQDFGAKDKDTE